MSSAMRERSLSRTRSATSSCSCSSRSASRQPARTNSARWRTYWPASHGSTSVRSTLLASVKPSRTVAFGVSSKSSSPVAYTAGKKPHAPRCPGARRPSRYTSSTWARMKPPLYMSGFTASPSAGGTAAAARGIRRATNAAIPSSGTAAICTHSSGSPAGAPGAGASASTNTGAAITTHSSRSATHSRRRARITRCTTVTLRIAAGENT